MAHQWTFRQGWQSQNLARFLLYKFSFVAEPAYTADDIGGDFFCTLFEIEKVGKRMDLLPKNSFWIQVKSEDSPNEIELSTLIPLLKKLEMPFFIGVVDRTALKLTIYSGHYLIPLFCYKDPTTVQKLKALRCEASSLTGLNDDYFTESSPGDFALLCPKVTEITPLLEDDALQVEVKKLEQSCSLMLANIASRISNEYTLTTHDGRSNLYFSGPTSLKFFEENFIKRLAEALFNVNHAYNYPQYRASARNLFTLYERIYNQIAVAYQDEQSLSELTANYQAAKRHIDLYEDGTLGETD